MSDDVTKHTIELAKNSEQVFRFNRELTETKDILKSFMVKYDMFSQEVSQNFSDYENALTDLEKRVFPVSEELLENNDHELDSNKIAEEENNDMIVSEDIKSMIKQEFSIM